MPVRVWLLESDEERLLKHCKAELEHYADCASGDTIVSGAIEQSGIISHLKQDFVLGKVRFWERKGSKHRIPFVRIDNHCAFPNGAIFSPLSRIDVKYHKKAKTIDQKTALRRIELLSAPDNDFIRRVFATYEVDSLVSKPRDFEGHLLVYCDEQHLYKGKVADLYASARRQG